MSTSNVIQSTKNHEKLRLSNIYIPPGYGKPGYVPESKIPLHLGIQVALGVVMLVVVGLRFYTRMFLVRALGWDDGWILMATASCISLLTIHGACYKSGLGLHAIDALTLNPNAFSDSAFFGFLAAQLHIITMYLIKMSILVFIHRIVARGRTVNIVYGLYVFVTVYGLTSFFLYTFQCKPVRDFWFLNNPEGRDCLNLVTVMYFTSIGNSILDVVILLLPMPDLMTIHIERKEKFIIIGILAIGGVATIASIIRAAWVRDFAYYIDITWKAANPVLMTGIEPLLSIICCSVPSLKKLFSHVFCGRRSTPSSRSRPNQIIALHLRKNSSKLPKTTESTEEFQPDISVPLEHKYQSSRNNRVTIETLSRDTQDMENEPAPGQITVRKEYSQTVVVERRGG